MIIWDDNKYSKLLIERGIRLDEIEKKILNQEYIKVIENKTNPNQLIFIINYKNYIHAVPFIIDKEGNIIIKTVFPSRKLNKIYGGK